MTEELLFHMYKDTNLIGAQYFKKEIRKYKIADPNALYIRIVNYQIKKYGGTLVINCEKGNKELAVHKSQLAYKRRQSRKRVLDMSEQMYQKRR